MTYKYAVLSTDDINSIHIDCVIENKIEHLRKNTAENQFIVGYESVPNCVSSNSYTEYTQKGMITELKTSGEWGDEI
jgi:hypothetical protein